MKIDITSATIDPYIPPDPPYLSVWKQIPEILSRHDAREQMTVAIEELAELQKEICKYLRYAGTGKLEPSNYQRIKEELADAQLMILQLQHILLINPDDIEYAMIYKVERLRGRDGGGTE